METGTSTFVKKVKISVAIFTLVFHIVLIILFFVYFSEVISSFNSFTNWVSEHPFTGLILIMLCFIIGVALMIPRTFFTFIVAIECENLFGGILGFIISLFLVFICTTCGATLAFLFTRYLLKQIILSEVKPSWHKTRAVLKALEHKGFKLVFLFRLAPIIPFTLLNYALGASSVSFEDYVFGSIGLIPKLALYVYVAISVGSLKEAIEKESDDTILLTVVLVIGTVIGILATVYLAIISKRELEKIIQETQPMLEESEEHKSSIEGE